VRARTSPFAADLHFVRQTTGKFHLSAISERIDALVRDGLAPVLRAAGYRKTGRTWRQAADGWVRVTNVQGSWTNIGETGKFTINLGVYFPEAAVLRNGPPAVEKPNESDCIVHERIGFLLPVRQDHWWEIRPATDLPQLINEVSHAWVNYGKPWLELHSDLSRAEAFLERKGLKAWAAVFSILRHDVAKAKALLAEAIAQAERSPQLASSLRQWGQQHELL
jgi:hypothetical protein